MKKILFFMFALLAVTACDSMWGGTDDSTAADVAGDVTIEFSAVGDYGFTVTLTPTRAASYYSYLVDDDDVDVSAELDASTLYSCGYSSVTKGIVDYSEFPSYTFTLDGLDPDQTYFVYAVAGSPEGNVGAICAKSVVTNYVPDYGVSLSKVSWSRGDDTLTATVSMTDDVESVRVAVVERDSSEELEDTVYGAIDAIIDGTVDYKTVTDSCAVQFSVTVDGSYVVVAVAFGGGEAVDFDYATFKVDHSSWTSLGLCEYTDDYIASVYIGSAAYCVTYEVEIQENDDTPGLYRLVNPYGEAYPYNDPGDWDDTEDYYMEINASDPDGVYIDYQNTGLDWGYGPFYVYSYAAYYLDYGYSLAMVMMMGCCGTFEKGVITFPQMSLLCAMPEYDNYYYYANDYGMFKVVMPGTVILDCSVDVSYVGELTDSHDNNYAVATVELGEDVEYALVAMAEGKDHDALVKAIEAGTVECQTLTESGGVEFPCEESGTFTIAVVTYADDEPQESAYVTFTYTAVAQTWSKYGEGDYYYSGYLAVGADPGLEIYQSDVIPSRFKIEHWGYDVDFYFTWDQDSNEIVVDEQTTGATYYGEDVYVTDMSVDYSSFLYYGTPGYYENGVFYFAVDYYFSAGEFGYGYEFFALDGETNAPALADITGEYYAYEYAVDYGEFWGGSYTLEESDDADYGNVMFTLYDDFDNSVDNIYGTYDEETGIAEFDCDQLFSIYGSYYIAASLYYYYDTYPITFLFFNNGDFWGPFYGDMTTSDTYMMWGHQLMYAGYYYAYPYVYGFKYSYGPGSVAPTSAKGLGSRPASVEPKEKSRNHIRATKESLGKSKRVEVDGDIVLASSSTRPTGDSSSANASKKSGSKKISGKVSTDTKPAKESTKDAIREAKGWKN